MPSRHHLPQASRGRQRCSRPVHVQSATASERAYLREHAALCVGRRARGHTGGRRAFPAPLPTGACRAPVFLQPVLLVPPTRVPKPSATASFALRPRYSLCYRLSMSRTIPCVLRRVRPNSAVDRLGSRRGWRASPPGGQLQQSQRQAWPRVRKCLPGSKVTSRMPMLMVPGTAGTPMARLAVGGRHPSSKQTSG